jgi:hypothetical protein
MIHFDRPVNYKQLKLIENVNAVFCNFEIKMPTILLIAGWRLYFWANEKNEPIHIHAEKGDMECKFWLDIENFEIKTALEYNLTPQARREI